jgi:hypothetical protein
MKLPLHRWQNTVAAYRTILPTFYCISPRQGSLPRNALEIVVQDRWRPYHTLKAVLQESHDTGKTCFASYRPAVPFTNNLAERMMHGWETAAKAGAFVWRPQEECRTGKGDPSIFRSGRRLLWMVMSALGRSSKAGLDGTFAETYSESGEVDG